MEDIYRQIAEILVQNGRFTDPNLLLQALQEAGWLLPQSEPMGLDDQPAHLAAWLRTSAAGRRELVERNDILKALVEHFNDEELKTFCFQLGVDYDSLPASGKAGKARELVAHQERRGALGALAEKIRQERPAVYLPETRSSNEGWAQLIEALRQNEFVSGTGNEKLRTLVEGPQSQQDERENIDSQLLSRIVERWQQGRLVLFVGADLPQNIGGVPSRQALADELARQHQLPEGHSLDWITQQIGYAGSQWEVTDFLLSALDVEQQNWPLYEMVVQLVQRFSASTVITTKYDNLLSQAFSQAAVPVQRVIQDSGLQFMRPGRVRLLKLLGDWQNVDSLLITEQSLNALRRGQVRPQLFEEVKMAFRGQAILFVGHYVHDPLVLSLLDAMNGRFQIPSYAVWSGLSSAEVASFRSNRNLTVVDADPLVFMQALLDIEV